MAHPDSLPRKKEEKRATGYGVTTSARMTPVSIARRVFFDTVRFHNLAHGVELSLPHRVYIATLDAFKILYLTLRARSEFAKANPYSAIHRLQPKHKKSEK